MVFDLAGYGFANYDLNWCYEVISAVQAHYPYRLGTAVVISAPLAFRACA